ncbi:hypothetical protein GGP41_009344 [Bipolaris sorokiniana]|uniref:Rhodopsin domain-containing protein n=2 Tax=Cochliobolus sativus TaxID=45130 RepID=A0A8H6DQG4_COCSA|nr:uncharacterized protein COCSADRAFT_188497 [Bipolaris sorokiniana ND90Pr]EMD67868.1 hypothetical protein COCSADRAFT_188497 [Bipolaris sorokiniana ND90Pr]KAF5844023.1 hypothetical protein GGP41_009344 [Bipolaris sorokiniana]
MASDQGGTDETRVPTALAIVTIFTVLSCACVALRLYTRKIILRNIGADDYVIVVAQVLNFGVSAGNYAILTAGGAGRHIEFVKDKLTVFSKILLAAIALYNATQIAIKISLLLQYGKIFPGRNMRLICNWGTVFLLIWGGAQQVFTPFICTFTGITHIPEGVCVGNNTLAALNAVMNVVTDFLILIIPFKPVLQLQINLLRKVYLLAILCMGLAVCIISAIRLNMLIGPKYDWDDITWQIGTVASLSTLETSLGIMCACIPTLRPLLKRFSPKMAGSSGKDQSTTGNQFGTKRETRYTSNGPLKSKITHDNAIYIQKDVHFQSTTELRDVSHKEPYQVSQRSSDDISL